MPTTLSDAVRLAPGVGVATFGGSVVVLDIWTNRYTQYGGKLAEALHTLAERGLCDLSQQTREALGRRGLLDDGSRPGGRWLGPQDMPEPQTSVVEGPERARSLTWQDGSVAIACLVARLDLRIRPLHRLLGSLSWSHRGHSTADLVACARSFDRARRLAPVAPRCLPDTLAFVRRARRIGQPVHLVFGVKLHPFEAHCWAQCADLVLTDPLDRVRRFVPILVV